MKEAEDILKKRINYDLSHGRQDLRVIVGKGLHLKGGVAKIKPSVEQLCEEAGLDCHVDPKNSGVLVIRYTHGNTVPHWPQSHTQQPQHQQQPHYSQGQSHGGQGFSTGNLLADGLLKLFCLCLKNYSK